MKHISEIIREDLGLNRKNSNEFNQLDFDKMETKNIFHKNTIKKTCVKFRLRFLDSNLFKGDYPKNITNIISDLEKTFWDAFRMILNAFASKTLKNMF